MVCTGYVANLVVHTHWKASGTRTAPRQTIQSFPSSQMSMLRKIIESAHSIYIALMTRADLQLATEIGLPITDAVV